MATAHLYTDDTGARAGVRRVDMLSPAGHEELRFERNGGPLSQDGGADPFVVATLLLWMQRGLDLHVHGSVSKRLLLNLNELQLVWAKWRPQKYSVVQITADHLSPTRRAGDRAIAAFSGGLDASFTCYRHLVGPDGFDPALSAVVLVHGLDIPLRATGRLRPC